MSDQIKHECGIVLLRLLKPLEYYKEKYGTVLYGVNKLNLLLEKQHNRGQDGAGVACIKFNVPPGNRYIGRIRSNAAQPLKEIFSKINASFQDAHDKSPERFSDPDYLKTEVPVFGELLMGHLRYGTFGKNNIENCHPFLRQNNWMSRNLVVAGNFNLTNVEEQFHQLLELGQHPIEFADTVTVLEKIGHFIDVENQRLFLEYKRLGYPNHEISSRINKNIDLAEVLRQASKRFDGGYVITGMLGHGDAFALRDPNGIRPAYYIANDEVIAVTSERPVLQTVFNVPFESVKELDPGNALIIKRNGDFSEQIIREPLEKKSCSFERIYFSRGSDANIYKERKELGRLLTPIVLENINHDFENTVFSFIPNTAETAFLGLIKGIEDHLNDEKLKAIIKGKNHLDETGLKAILDQRPRVEKIAIKDVKLRTFITEDVQRDEMVAHVYDITYGTVNTNKDSLVVLDDSIVRGTTLKQSILKMLDRLAPKQIIIVSSAPQIRYPDCYGIDMAKLGDFIAFQAAISLHNKNGTRFIIDQVYEKCVAQEEFRKEDVVNYVKEIYAPFTDNEISDEIALLVKPSDINAKVKVIYQTLENLHRASPNHRGDWYFSGDYPTPGGNKVVNKAFINYYRKVNERAY
jgi:amidophosphoribosyltransferase